MRKISDERQVPTESPPEPSVVGRRVRTRVQFEALELVVISVGQAMKEGLHQHHHDLVGLQFVVFGLKVKEIR